MALGGEGHLAGVAARGDTWVAVGWNDLPAMDAEGRVRVPLLYLSTDAGASWTPQQVAEPAWSAGFATLLSAVDASADGFVAVGSAFQFEGSRYRAWTWESPDGVAWTPGDVPAVTSAQFPQAVVHTDGATHLVATGDQANRTSVQVFSRGSSAEWTQVETPPLAGTAWVNAAVGVGSAVLLSVGASDRVNDEVLWRVEEQGDGWSEFRIPVPEGSGARTEPARLLLRNGVLTAWGNAQGALGVWQRGEDGAFGPPRIVRDEPREDFGGVVTGDPGLLVIGSREGEAQVLTSSDGQTWTEAGPGTFNAVANFHSSSLSDAVWAHDRWIVVGSKSTNGSVRASALISSSSDGASWRQASGTSVLARGDAFADDVLTDLQGLENNGRHVEGVATVPSGVLAVGSTTSIDGDRPAVWRSSDKAVWALDGLSYDGFAAARAADVVTQGERVVVLGFGRAADNTDWTPLVWVSTDGGATFTQGRLGDQGRSGPVLLRSAEGQGFVAVAAAWNGDAPTVWRSPDGLTWTGSPVEVPNAADGVEASVSDALVEGDVLHVLLFVTNRLDSVPIIVDVPLG